MKIGILAVQGDFEAHAAMLEGLGAETVEVRTPADLEGCDGLVLPGGESTTQLQFLQEEGLAEAIEKFAKNGGAIFGTCAGAILLAMEVENPRLETSARDKAKDTAPSNVPNFGDSRLDVCDDRVVIIGSMPDARQARCTYLARAVTPGVYIVPPVRAEQMYDINCNAIAGAGATLVVTSSGGNIASVHEDVP